MVNNVGPFNLQVSFGRQIRFLNGLKRPPFFAMVRPVLVGGTKHYVVSRCNCSLPTVSELSGNTLALLDLAFF